ncbi:hypothetical protein [Actinomadura rugatobispora]|uniref:DUF4175 domain-containing protein n=1 Tax=Actinomadura rugatobispora TaxID=1994 RepID=A0ABW1AA30_9ACTN|nr:hypothetical protein GCM10010200_010020 [Actinomadura rugatobispora]
MDQVRPAVIVPAAMIVFVVFLVLAGLPMAVAMALTTLVAAAILVTLVTGTAWLTPLRRLVPHLRERH